MINTMQTLIWKLLIIALVMQDVDLNKTVLTGRECFVYELNSYNKVRYKIEDSKFSVGFLRANTTEPPSQILIFIYFEEGVHLQLYINPLRKIVLRYNELVIGKPGRPLLPIQYFPSWYTLLISLSKKEITIKRPDLIRIFAKWKLPKGLPEKFQKIVIVSSGIQQVTLNCLTNCPIFHSAEVGNLMMNFNESFDVFLTSAVKETKFNYGLSVPKLKGTTTKMYSPPILETEEYLLKFIITTSTVDTDQCTLTNSLQGTVTETFRELNCTNPMFSFTAYNSQNLSWSFDCQYHNDTKEIKLLGQDNIISKRTFGISEAVAWVIASLSLLGLIIVALTLYARMVSHNWVVEGTESAISNSHINGMEMVPFPRVSKSIFFRDLRKPEVGSVRDGRDSTVSLDKLYPLKFEMEDNRSQRDLTLTNDLEHFSSLRSDKTIITTISNF